MPKVKNSEKLDFQLLDFLKTFFFIRIDAPMYFFNVSAPGIPPKYPKKLDLYPFFKNYDFYVLYKFI